MAAAVNGSAESLLGAGGNVFDTVSSFWYHPIVFGVRRMFALVGVEETSFEKVEDVPNYLVKAIPYFYSFFLVEIIVLLMQGKHLRLNDSISSMICGIMSLLPKVIIKPIEVVIYVWAYEHFHMVDLPWDHWATWWLAFVAVDFGYYWLHRMSHEVNFMWAAHQVHHSSEDFNLGTAMRQSVLQKFHTWIFYAPLSIAIPPSVFVVHNHFNLIYQFWIHTEVVRSLGPLEYILNTPSHHRVHHGRNRYCIDTNYGGTLIIWDRLFNTFAAEDDEVVYGLVHPLGSWDVLYIQFGHWQYMIKTAWHMEGFANKLAVFWKGPGWEPGKPRMGLIEDIPEVPDASVGKYDKQIPSWFHLYTYSHFILAVLGYTMVQSLKESEAGLDLGVRVVAVLYVLWTLTDIGYIYEDKWYIGYLEMVRCMLYIVGDVYLCGGACSNWFYVPRALYMLSIAFWLGHFTKMSEKNTDAKKVL